MIIKTEQEMLEFGSNFAKDLPSTKQHPTIIELIGDVGAGKTTFTRGLAAGLNATSPITSPSFTISKSYALPTGGHLIHYDFYRLSDPGLMINDLQENLQNPKNIIIIEWGKSIKNILPKSHITLTISQSNDGSRNISTKNIADQSFQKHPQKENTNLIIPTTIMDHKKHTTNSASQLSLYLDTSTPTTILKLNDKEYSFTFANDLAEKLLSFIHKKLTENKKSFKDIAKITFMSGPGSFTGLRIGASIVNTLASELNIPLYDHHGLHHPVIIPEYGRPANISKPQK